MSARAQFSRDVGRLTDVFEFTSDFAERESLSEGHVYAMNLAVEELFTNIVKYGNPDGGDVDIALGIDDGNLVIEIVDDDAEPFDPTATQPVDVDKALEARREGGLGIHLIRSIMDYVKYEYQDRCSRIVLKKRLEDPHV